MTNLKSTISMIILTIVVCFASFAFQSVVVLANEKEEIIMATENFKAQVKSLSAEQLTAHGLLVRHRDRIRLSSLRQRLRRRRNRD